MTTKITIGYIAVNDDGKIPATGYHSRIAKVYSSPGVAQRAIKSSRWAEGSEYVVFELVLAQGVYGPAITSEIASRFKL